MPVLLPLLLATSIQASIPREEYQARRAALRKALPNAVIVLDGATENEKGGLRGGFFQDSNFLYLTGWTEPNAWLVLAPGAEVLLLPKRSEVRERYTGRKLDPGDEETARATGFAKVKESDALDALIKELAADNTPVHAVPKSEAAARAERALGRAPEDLRSVLARLRMVKSAREIELLRATTDSTVAAHKAAWRRVAAGLHEYQVAATMRGVYLERGCERDAYTPIVASGPNAVILHYAKNRRRMDRGELLLMDVGSECAAYAADITRTIPVNGKFTPRQREIYDIVLGAQKAAIAAAKPGMKFIGTNDGSLNAIALDYINSHGADKRGEKLGKYYVHTLGHHVGLDVHDPTDTSLTLQAGMVITIEPGLYIPEEQIGVRIEDMVLITEHGAELLSKDLPREAAEIEKFLSRTQSPKKLGRDATNPAHARASPRDHWMVGERVFARRRLSLLQIDDEPTVRFVPFPGKFS